MNIGILGGGQLGRMLTLAAYPLGITCSCYESAEHPSASYVGDVRQGDVDDIKRLESWVDKQDVLTYEWENFAPELVAHIGEQRPVFPNVLSLATAQDRWHEKVLFDELDIPVAPFRFASDERELRNAVDDLDFPCVVKTRNGGYDGKGQVVVRSPHDLDAAIALFEIAPVIVETFVEFTSEVSVIGVRGRDGQTALYPVTQNTHVDGILRVSVAPAPISTDVRNLAWSYAAAIMKKLDYVGTMALELFVTRQGLFANEMAPRVHNSGHWTQDGAETSQFENHLRAVAGLPLGSTRLTTSAGMVNCIGFVPDHESVLAIEGTHLHVYDKAPRAGRKVGHINVTAPSPAELDFRIEAVQKVIDASAANT